MSNYNPNSGYGQGVFQAVSSVVPTFGKILVVAGAATDANYGRMTQLFKPDPDGVIRLFTTVAEAYAAATSNENDVIVLDGQTTHTVTSMLTVAKNRVHFIGLDGGGHLTAQGAKIQIGATGVATDLAPVMVTGVRCSFRNIKFINASTTNETLYGFIDNGEGTVVKNCQMAKVAGLDDANHAHFWMAGDSLTMEDVVIGQSNLPSAAAGFGILIDGKTGGATDGTVKENFLKNVYINMQGSEAAKATSAAIKVADGSALNFGNVIVDLVANNFIQNGVSAMSTAVISSASVAGSLSLVRPSFFGFGGVQASGAGKGVNIANSVAAVAAGGLSTALTD